MTAASDPLALFLEVASDLYQTDIGYRREIEREAGRGEPEPPARKLSQWERMNELEWLVTNGMSIHFACAQLDWTVHAANQAATAWSHPVRKRFAAEEVTGLSGGWAQAWLSGERQHAA